MYVSRVLRRMPPVYGQCPALWDLRVLDTDDTGCKEQVLGGTFQSSLVTQVVPAPNVRSCENTCVGFRQGRLERFHPTKAHV